MYFLEPDLSLAHRFLVLTSAQRRIVHFILCEQALETWLEYTDTHTEIVYVESIAGTHQVVDPQLPFDAFHAAEWGERSDEITRRYLEPIAAMQDEDLVFPNYIVYAFYAIYNLFLKYTHGKIIDDWLIVNQALSTRKDGAGINQLLSNAIDLSLIMDD